MLKRSMKNTVTYIEEGKVWESKWKGVKQISQAHIDAVTKSYPKATILNALPFEEALDRMMKATA